MQLRFRAQVLVQHLHACMPWCVCVCLCVCVCVCTRERVHNSLSSTCTACTMRARRRRSTNTHTNTLKTSPPRPTNNPHTHLEHVVIEEYNTVLPTIYLPTPSHALLHPGSIPRRSAGLNARHALLQGPKDRYNHITLLPIVRFNHITLLPIDRYNDFLPAIGIMT